MRKLNKKGDDFDPIKSLPTLFITLLLLALLIGVAVWAYNNYKTANSCATVKGKCSDTLQGSPSKCSQISGASSEGQRDCKEGYECCLIIEDKEGGIGIV